MNNEEKQAIEILKGKQLKYHLDFNDELYLFSIIEKQAKEIEDKKEEMYAIARANYILGQTEERSQWYKKINEKIEEYQEKRRKAEVQIANDMYVNYINCLKELIGKEE